ncbi:uncharacterized protein ATNIH1004_004830 [Aspergillus tanneri]|uniref:Uncharacterized protein n=1 Tax=Aspergillus tanneri TaxID=1220188 RepID=A0A5M9MPE1_9EURO|nr:uncharacterized protein ATNIH1004_004830 [Aspergillus tanneri]KAA8648941.1 hypothetical protein ATNIH1004_004830 [Aspergillus tanneri]
MNNVDDFPDDHELIDKARLAGIREGEDEGYEQRQCRALVVQWASADQSFRDSFHLQSAVDYPFAALTRIESRSHKFSNFICINSVDTPVKRTRFIKILVLAVPAKRGDLAPFHRRGPSSNDGGIKPCWFPRHNHLHYRRFHDVFVRRDCRFPNHDHVSEWTRPLRKLHDVSLIRIR